MTIKWQDQYPKLAAYLQGAFEESSAPALKVANCELLASTAEARQAEDQLEIYPIELVAQMGYYDLVPHDSDPTGKGESLITMVREIANRYF